MKTFTNLIISSFNAFFIAIFVVLSGCIDDSVQTDYEIVEGRIYDIDLSFYNYVASPGEYPIAFCDEIGNFTFEISSLPYDLVIGKYSYQSPDSPVKYKNLSLKNPQVIHTWQYYDILFAHNLAKFYVEFPQPHEFRKIAIKFVSSDLFDEGFDWVTFYNYDYKRIYFDKVKSSIAGKLVFLEVSVDLHGNILSYEKFGIKNLTLVPGDNPAVVFSTEDIAFNPPEREASFNVNLQSGYQYSGLNVMLGSEMYYNNSDLRLREVPPVTGQGVILPVLPDSTLKIKITLDYKPSSIFEEGRLWKYYTDENPIEFNHPETFQLFSPADLTHNINDTSWFEITENGGPAIYEFIIDNSRSSFRLHTTEKKVQLKEFKAWGFKLLPNTDYYWAVRKYPNFSSIDEFLSKPFILDHRYDHIEITKTRKFTTAP